MGKRIGKGIATGTVAVALAAFPAGAAATNGHGNSDQQNAPRCESGQGTAIDASGDFGRHFGKFLSCYFNVPPGSSI